MNNKIIEFRDFYKVQKTITFELKPVDKYDADINFIKTAEYIEKEYFNKINNTDGIAEIKQLIEYGANLLFFNQELSLIIKNGNLTLRALEVDKNLIQKCDKELYHTLKKKKVITVKRINRNTNKEYNHELRFNNPMILLDVFEMNGKGRLFFLTDYLDKLNSRLALFQSKIRTDLETIYSKQTEAEKILYFESGKVNFYGNIKVYLSVIKDLMEILNLIKQSKLDYVNEPNWNKTKKVLDDLEILKNEYKNLAEILKIIENVINEEAKKPVILTSLNPRAINKDQNKIDGEWEKVQELEKEIKKLEMELSGINGNKRDVVEKLEWALKKNIDSLKVLDNQTSIGKQASDLHQKISQNRNPQLNGEEYPVLKQFKFAKRVMKYIKLNGVLALEKKHIFNYGKLNEKINFNSYKPQDNPPKIETHSKFSQFKKEYYDYKNLCDDKFKKSQQLGNAKSFYNAIRREVERQKEMKYISLLCKDNNFYYLVLIDKDYNKTNKIISNLLSNFISDWQMLEYHKITFKAIEKLALLDKSTFDVGDWQLTNEIKKMMVDYKEKQFKEYKLSKNEKYDIFNENQQERKRIELQKNELIKLIDYIKKVIVKLDDCKNFNFKESVQYQNLEEFADEIDKQGYENKWLNINKEKLFELEKQGGKNVLIFKLHNKDFRKNKTNKENLFTKYWRDAMNLGNDIRITPEIDVLKQNNEITKDKKIIVKKTGEQKTVKDKFRFNQNKLYGAFNLEFYPTRKSDFETVNKKVVFYEQIYYLGLDRGENSLVSWCFIDSNGTIINNGDWTKFKSKNDYEITNKEHNYAEDLKEYQKEKQKLFEKYQEISSCGEKNEKEKLLELVKELEKEVELKGFLTADKIKKGYCGYLIDGINKILKEYPNTYIVLEDLDMKYNKDGTLKTGDENINNKMKNLEKTFGATVYQAIENAIVNKFKYYVVKDKKEYDGLQLVPNIVKVEDLRVIKEDDDKNKFGKTKWVKSKDKVGNILFIDEYLTSKTCPVCGYISEKRLKNIDSCENKECQESKRKKLSERLRASDDIAAYNIAKKGMQLKK